MLSPADADLVRRDTAVPGLGTVLDPDVFVSVLRREAPWADIGAARPVYVRYKPGMNCLVAYQLEVAGATVAVYARAYGPDAPAKLSKVRVTSSAPAPLGPGHMTLADTAIQLVIFPTDLKLAVLPRLTDATARQHLLRRLMPDRPDLWAGTLHSLRYKPERRYVARLHAGAAASVVLKAYAEPAYAAAQTSARIFRSHGPLQLARWLGGSRRHHVLALEWLPGRALDDVMMDQPLRSLPLAGVGAALAELHRQNPAGLRRLAREAEAASLQAVADGLGFVCPSLGPQANRLARRLAGCLVEAVPGDQPIHGDFYARQVVIDGDAVAILDLDEAMRGDGMADLGNFVAHLERSALCGALAPSRVEPIRAWLCDGYRTTGASFVPTRVDLHAAAGLLRLAPHPFRDRAPNWPEQTEAILARAEALLDAARRPTPGTGGRRQDATCRPPATPRVPVTDPFNVAADPMMAFVARALAPDIVQPEMERCLPRLAGAAGEISLQAIRVTRHKPGRRCLIEYDMALERPDASFETITLVGKARARGLDTTTIALQTALWQRGFGATSDDGLSVPEPIGTVPAFRMWLQRKAPGVPATERLPATDGVILARRLAEVAHKLHRAGIPSGRCHTMADELRILHARLPAVAELRPEWSERLARVLDACDRLGTSVPAPSPRGIHRDFYPDQVIVDGTRLYLIDCDLYCVGDPALDIGNCLGHMTEQALRTMDDPDALADRQAALEERFLELAGTVTRAAVRAYALLTLVRHIALSTRFPERRHCTGALLDVCEQRLGVTRGAPVLLAAN